jgi:hypothetical protein
MAIEYFAIASASMEYDTGDIVSNTDVRDVSDMLDLWVHRRTPFLNYVKWGPESGAATTIEWIREHLGLGYITIGLELTGSAGSLDVVLAGTVDLGGVTNAMNQIGDGAVLMGWASESATNALVMVNSATLAGTLSFDMILTGTVDTGSKMYILGNFANEGSEPRQDRSRARVIMTNTMTILRKDVRITGSMAATDMHAVADEVRHQMRLRLLEMQKEREMACLFSKQVDRSTTAAGLLKGIYYFFIDHESGNHVDSTTTSLTESAFNTVCAACWDNGCTPNAVFGSSTQIRKFTEWDRARVRTTPRAELGGFHVTQYLTDVGIEVDLVPIQHFPPGFLFILNTDQVKLRAKKGRKLIIEKLGIKGDYKQWQMISEFSMEARGAGNGELGGIFSKLS